MLNWEGITGTNEAKFLEESEEVWPGGALSESQKASLTQLIPLPMKYSILWLTV